MTGEPEAVHKSELDPFLLGGCLVTEGGGVKSLCIAVGIHSQWFLSFFREYNRN